MKTNVVLSLDSRRPKADGSCPIVLRISHFSSTTAISTGYSVLPEYWNELEKKIKNGYKGTESVARLNNTLYKQLVFAKDVVLQLFSSGELNNMSLAQVRQRLTIAEKTSSLTEFVNTQIQNLHKMNRFGTARAYKSSLQAITKHLKKENVLFRDINYQFLKSFETAYLSRKNSYNGLSAILRSLRAIINKAIKESLIEDKSSPFEKYTIINKPTAKRAINDEAINKIIELKLNPENSLFEARNLFILSYYLWGMNLSDLAYLQVKDIIDGRLKYSRKKTSRPYDIKILPQIQLIFDYYIEGKTKDDFILPIIKRVSEADQDKDILWYRKRYNKKLKTLALKCGIQENLTSYVSRHSFATLAEESGIPIRVISKMLGHSRLSTTEIYLKSLSANTLDEYHNLLIKRKG